ncbi:MAG: class flavin-dependent oxidoreductase [Frankiales bacterium]|jgi:alkanesulfonate monooxygenase SsuD/methylene tetrahydromethanopterin reductase-like flavin-dependent oxidoreductase (luciferase family)|nr:class flavin-dependent oxidoreductase [Frankiales bacterium]
MQTALFVPIFDELAEPAVVARVAAQAEEAGWDGLFVWDHLAYADPVDAIADPWITLAAIACATERLRIGPMVTPLSRRRPAVVARQVTSLDRLSGGRVVLGVGTGDDGASELSGTGEQLDPKVRGDMLDEHLDVLRQAWTGVPVTHRGEHYLLDGLTLHPTPVQRPGVPIWVGARYGSRRPLRRAARHDGVFPIQVTEPAQLAEVVEAVGGSRSGFDVAIAHRAGTDTAGWAEAGATWWLTSFSPYGITLDEVRGVVADGPPIRT